MNRAAILAFGFVFLCYGVTFTCAECVFANTEAVSRLLSCLEVKSVLIVLGWDTGCSLSDARNLARMTARDRIALRLIIGTPNDADMRSSPNALFASDVGADRGEYHLSQSGCWVVFRNGSDAATDVRPTTIDQEVYDYWPDTGILSESYNVGKDKVRT